MKICLQWIVGSLISNSVSVLEIQNGETKFRQSSNFYKNLYMRVFGNADLEFAIRFWKFEMAVRI